ncbi:MAG: hypothetical protein AB1781_10335 [Pseudomonadota bacterium]
MRGLKFLVVFLGVLILGGIVFLGVTIAGRMSGKLEGAPGGGHLPAFETAKVTLPKGARLEGTEAEGDRLLLRLRLADGAGRILILDLNDGRLLGTVELEKGR